MLKEKRKQATREQVLPSIVMYIFAVYCFLQLIELCLIVTSLRQSNRNLFEINF